MGRPNRHPGKGDARAHADHRHVRAERRLPAGGRAWLVTVGAVGAGALMAIVLGTLVLPAKASRAAGADGTSATLYLSPASVSVARGATFTVDVRIKSDTDAVNALEADLAYPDAMLDYVGTSVNDATWGITASSTGGSGSVSIQVGAIAPVSGDELVARVTFAASAPGAAAISFAASSAAVSAATNADILGATAGGTYTIPGSGDGAGAGAGTPGTETAGVQTRTGASRPSPLRASVRVRGWHGRMLRLRMGCPSAAPSRCRVGLSVQLRGGRSLGTATVSIWRGRTRAAAIALPAAIVRRLRGHPAALSLRIKTVTSAGATSATITLAPPR